MELKSNKILKKLFRNITFNRTAYGIEMSFNR